MPVEGEVAKTEEKAEEKVEEVESKTEEIEEEVEEKDDEKEDDEEELTPEQRKQAKNLFKLLQDPNSARITIQALASQAGLIETKKEAAEVKKDILSVLKEEMGEEYGNLPDKLARSLEKIVEAAVAEKIAPSQAKLAEIEGKTFENEVDSAMRRLNKETDGAASKLESDILQLMDQYLPGKDPETGKTVSVYKYLKGLHEIASAGQKNRQIKKKIADKIQENANDMSRLRSSGASDERVRSSEKLTLDQIIAKNAQKLLRGE